MHIGMYDCRSVMPSGNKDDNSKRVQSASDFVVMTVMVLLLVDPEGIHDGAGSPLSGPVPMATQTPLAYSPSH